MNHCKSALAASTREAKVAVQVNLEAPTSWNIATDRPEASIAKLCGVPTER